MREQQARRLTDKEKRALKQPPISGGMDSTVYVGKRGKRKTVAEMVDALVNPRARRF